MPVTRIEVLDRVQRQTGSLDPRLHILDLF